MDVIYDEPEATKLYIEHLQAAQRGDKERAEMHRKAACVVLFTPTLAPPPSPLASPCPPLDVVHFSSFEFSFFGLSRWVSEGKSLH